MNLQQLRYIIAVNRFRNFAKAADSCNVSQPTLSAMLQKLEEELDIRIFDRTNRSVTPTTAGEKIIRQAENALMEIERIGEIVSEDKGQIGGGFRLSVGPTIAPYILPKFIRHYREMYPTVELSIQEMKVNFMIEALQRGELDAGMAISGNVCDGVLEIPLYAEKFMVYLAESCWRKLPVFKPENLEHENMWIMKDAQCLRDSAFSFCKARSKGTHIYEAGSITTLVHIVDENGGFTIIPEMHLPFLNDRQRENVRPIEGDYLSQRRVSLYVKEDYVLVADIIDACVFGTISAIISTYMMSVKCQRILYGQRVVIMSEIDMLTGVRNRNSYEQNLSIYPSLCKKNLSCIFADLNGLHELNNTKGHEAGDKMLQFVAEKLVEQFGKNNTYRIGGDEFVSFVIDGCADEIQKKINMVVRSAKEQEYYVSIGYDTGFCSDMDMGSLINTAEMRMYAAKKQFYQQKGMDRRIRVCPGQEQNMVSGRLNQCEI